MPNQVFLNHDQASSFTESIEDSEVRNAVKMSLGIASVLALPHETSEGHAVAPLTPIQAVDLLFVARVLAEVFSRKQTVIDILCGRRKPENELL